MQYCSIVKFTDLLDWTDIAARIQMQISWDCKNVQEQIQDFRIQDRKLFVWREV